MNYSFDYFLHRFLKLSTSAMVITNRSWFKWYSRFNLMNLDLHSSNSASNKFNLASNPSYLLTSATRDSILYDMININLYLSDYISNSLLNSRFFNLVKVSLNCDLSIIFSSCYFELSYYIILKTYLIELLYSTVIR